MCLHPYTNEFNLRTPPLLEQGKLSISTSISHSHQGRRLLTSSTTERTTLIVVEGEEIHLVADCKLLRIIYYQLVCFITKSSRNVSQYSLD